MTAHLKRLQLIFLYQQQNTKTTITANEHFSKLDEDQNITDKIESQSCSIFWKQSPVCQQISHIIQLCSDNISVRKVGNSHLNYFSGFEQDFSEPLMS